MSYPGCAFRIQVLAGCFPSYDIPEPDLEFPRHGAEEGSASHLEEDLKEFLVLSVVVSRIISLSSIPKPYVI